MESVLIAALLAASPVAASGENAGAALPVAASGENAGAALDRQCFALMASLAGDEDPRISGAGGIAAQYFLGRLDAAGEIDAEAAAASAPEGAAREALLRRCGEAMQAGGRDFRALGDALAGPAQRPTA